MAEVSPRALRMLGRLSRNPEKLVANTGGNPAMAPCLPCGATRNGGERDPGG
jgi:hypothetical protein